MIPRPTGPPPVQHARRAVGFFQPPATVKALRPIPPQASRLEQRGVVADRWGHASLAGNDTDRQVVQGGPVESAMSPILCGVLGFLAVSLMR